MKKLISVLLVCTMLVLGVVPVFAADPAVEEKDYDLKELFAEYEEKNVADMVAFLASEAQARRFVEFFKRCANGAFVSNFYIHKKGTGRSPNVLEVGFTESSPKYLTSTARLVSASSASYQVLLGEAGDKVMTIELEKGFIEYINSLDSVEGNKLILNFLMNMMENDEIVGISWSFEYVYGGSGSFTFAPIAGDCNGDGALNAIDSNLIRKAVAGSTDCVDPLAVDMNNDGFINAKDSFALKSKLVFG